MGFGALLNIQLCIQILRNSYPRNPWKSVIFFLSLQPQLLQNSGVSSQSWLLQFTLLWHLTNKSQQAVNACQCSLARVEILQKVGTSHQHSKDYTGFRSGIGSVTKSVFSHTKHLQVNNYKSLRIVFHFRHILFLHGLLIHLFFPFHDVRPRVEVVQCVRVKQLELSVMNKIVETMRYDPSHQDFVHSPYSNINSLWLGHTTSIV